MKIDDTQARLFQPAAGHQPFEEQGEAVVSTVVKPRHGARMRPKGKRVAFESKGFGAGNPRMNLHDDGFAVTPRATDQGHHAPRQHFHAVEVPRGNRSVEPSPDRVRCRHRVASRPEAGPVRPEAAQLAVESVSAVCRRARVQDHAVMLALGSSRPRLSALSLWAFGQVAWEHVASASPGRLPVSTCRGESVGEGANPSGIDGARPYRSGRGCAGAVVLVEHRRPARRKGQNLAVGTP